MIINIDRKNRSINLSIKAKDHAEETEAMQNVKADTAGTTSGRTNLGALLRAKMDQQGHRIKTDRVMTKSELIDRLAAQFPQLVAKDAELAVKMISRRWPKASPRANASRSRVRKLRAQLSPTANRTQSQVRGQGAGAGEARPAHSRRARSCASG
jgi:hypothetical protein